MKENKLHNNNVIVILITNTIIMIRMIKKKKKEKSLHIKTNPRPFILLIPSEMHDEGSLTDPDWQCDLSKFGYFINFAD